MAKDELVVIDRTYGLLKWFLGRLEKFPRSHRYGLGNVMEKISPQITRIVQIAEKERDGNPRMCGIRSRAELSEARTPNKVDGTRPIDAGHPARE